MNYKIEYIPVSKLKTIEKEWRELATGEDMTVFQSYEWNLLLLEKYIPADTNNYVSIYVIIRHFNKICMIAPLWIIKRRFNLINKKGAYILGIDSFSDYLNLIYKVFDSEAFDFLIDNICKKYKIKKFYFSQINENTFIYDYIIKRYHIYKDETEPCVGIKLPSSFNEYSKLLSKHSRQNLRTANNRLIKDCKHIEYNMDDTLTNKNECIKIRESKLFKKYKQMSNFKIYKYRLKNKLQFRFPKFSPLICYSKSKIMTARIDNRLSAFFNYLYDDSHNKIVILCAGTELEYARYSPGMLLMYNFIKKVIDEGKYTEVDLTRGDESYKFALGGKLNNNHYLVFTNKTCNHN